MRPVAVSHALHPIHSEVPSPGRRDGRANDQAIGSMDLSAASSGQPDQKISTALFRPVKVRVVTDPAALAK